MNEKVSQENNAQPDVIPTPQLTPPVEGQKESITDIDKNFAEKVNQSLENIPQGDEVIPPADAPADKSTPEPNSDEYKPADEFMQILEKGLPGTTEAKPATNDTGDTPTTNQSQPDKSLSIIQTMLDKNPNMAPAIKEALAKDGITLPSSSDPVTTQRLAGMEEVIQNLVDTVNQDRNENKIQDQFEDANDMYLDVVKDMPKYERTLADFFSNSVLRDIPLEHISRETIQGAHKAVKSELDNYFNHRAKTEGYIKQTGIPPSGNDLGEITPPNQIAQAPQNSKLSKGAQLAELDADLHRKIAGSIQS